MKYKIGDKVKIKKTLSMICNNTGLYITDEMRKCAGKTAIISGIFAGGSRYFININNDSWSDEEFEAKMNININLI